jgi:hypothetical protein
MKTRIITGSFSALSFEARLKAVEPQLEEHTSHAAATHASAPRRQVELALRAPGSFRPAPLFVVGARIAREMKLDCEVYGGVLMGMPGSTLVKQRLVSRPNPYALHPPAGLASQPAGGPDFYLSPHDDESADYR